MTKIAQLVKEGRNSLIPQMEEVNFTHHGKLVFARTVGDGVHQIMAAELSYGENLKFSITCFVEEYEANYMEKYPFRIPITCGGRLGEDLIAGELWEVDDLENINDVYDDVYENFKLHALPWFERINCRKAYVDALYPHLREKLEESGRLNEVLLGSNKR